MQDFQKYNELGAYHWSEVRPAFKTTFNPYLSARYEMALSVIPEVKNNEVLVDFGCGDAYVSTQAAKLGYSVTGIDGSAEAIRLAKEVIPESLKAKVNLKVGNVYETGVESNSADMIISLDVIEHLDEPEKALAEMVRVAKRGAKILIGTPIRFTEKPLDKYHVHEFFPEEYVLFLSEYFDVIEVQKSHPLELLALMLRKFNFFGKQKYLGWNLINLYCLLTSKNPFFNCETKFPTYQLAICRAR